MEVCFENFQTEIPDRLKNILLKANLDNPREILIASDSSLMKNGATAEDVKLLKALSAKCLRPHFTKVSDLLVQQPSKYKNIFFGCEALDIATGGITTRGITEISGQAGSGKTQIALQLSIMVQLPEKYGGLEKGAIYINTEGQFPIKRLHQIAQHFKTLYPELKIDFLQNIYILHIKDHASLWKCINFRLPFFLRYTQVGLIVIDSIAGIYRIDKNIRNRARLMRQVVAILNGIIDRYGCVALCTNQVQAVMDEEGCFTSALGLAWQNLVRTSFVVKKTTISAIGSTLKTHSLRELEVLHSPRVGQKRAFFIITTEGIGNILTV